MLECLSDLKRDFHDWVTLSLGEVNWELLTYGRVVSTVGANSVPILDLVARFEVKSTRGNVDLARAEVLVLKQDPDLHLTLVEAIADLLKVIIDDLVQVVSLDLLQLGDHLLSNLLLGSVMLQHDLSFPHEEHIKLMLPHFPHPVDLIHLDIEGFDQFDVGHDFVLIDFLLTRHPQECQHGLRSRFVD